MKLPIIIYENGDVYIFKTRKEAENYLEPIDVENQEYVAYDSEGHLLKLEVESKPVRSWLKFLRNERVVIRDNHPSVEGHSELRKILIEYLSVCRPNMLQESLREASLQELVNKIDLC
jgi:hypothetical protein